MKKTIRFFVSCSLILTLLFTVSIPTFANDKIDKLHDVEMQISQDLINENLDASVKTLEKTETIAFLDYLKSKDTVVNLNNKLTSENFILDANLSAAFEIMDNASSNAVIFAFEFYKNASADTIVVTHVYDEITDTIVLTYAQKITSDSNISDFYVNKNLPSSDHSSTAFYKSKDVSFLCGLSSTVACGAFSAMLFAFVPASIAVGMSCSAAFALVCSYA